MLSQILIYNISNQYTCFSLLQYSTYYLYEFQIYLFKTQLIIKMSICILQELALQLSVFKNINMKQQGTYSIRFHVYYKDPITNKIIFSTPTTILQAQKSKFETIKKSEIVDQSYISSQFSIRYEEQSISINEICIFRTQIDTSIQYENYKLTLFCELLLNEMVSKTQYNLIKCSEFQAEILNTHCSEYLEITFDQRFACTLNGTIHAIAYKCQFKSNEEKIMRQRKFAQENKAKYHIQSASQIKDQAPILRNLDEYIKFATEKVAQKQLDYYIQLIQQQLIFIEVLYRQYFKILETNNDIKKIISLEEIQKSRRCLDQQKQRKKIFQISSLKCFSSKIHKLGNRIYHIWGNLIRIIHTIESILVPEIQKTYEFKIKEKYGECLIRHEIKGDWGSQKYERCGEEHILMSQKLRNTVIQDQIGLNFIDKSMFPNPKLKPIIFQQIYIRSNGTVLQQQSLKIKSSEKHLMIFVHGFGASRLDMQKLTLQIKKRFKYIQCFISISNQGKTETDIALMGDRLAKEIISYMSNNASKQIQKISFVGHSMGGVIIRCALPKLQQYSKKLHTFITLSSPHVGYIYNPSKLIDAGLWIINNVQKSQSILQLTMQDNANIEQTFLFKLSKAKGIEWFEKIALVSSYQDSYIPYESARIIKTQQTESDQLSGKEKGKRYNEMVQNIIKRITAPKLYRIDVNFQIPEQNIDNFIGRAAHIKFINCKQFIKMFVTTCEHLFT